MDYCPQPEHLTIPEALLLAGIFIFIFGVIALMTWLSTRSGD
jgi:hypothetical protein